MDDETGLGDIQYQGFLSPKDSGGIIWGAGPVVNVPSATDDFLGSEKWSAGAGVVVLTIQGPWVIGGLVNNIWSFAGSDPACDAKCHGFLEGQDLSWHADRPNEDVFCFHLPRLSESWSASCNRSDSDRARGPTLRIRPISLGSFHVWPVCSMTVMDQAPSGMAPASVVGRRRSTRSNGPLASTPAAPSAW